MRAKKGRGFWRLFLDRFRVPLLLLAGAITVGTVGFHLIEGWSFLDSLYMTVTTLTTVGFREVHPLGTGGRIFTIGLILSGVVTLFTTITVVASLILAGDLSEPLRRRRMERRIEGLRDHYIICAYGRVGRATADEFEYQGENYIIIENEVNLEKLLVERGTPYILGDPSGETVLKEAGIDRAKGLVSAVDSDAINVYITLTARTLNPKLNIVARASSPESVDQLYRAGADRVVSPYVLSGKQMASLALHPSVVDFLDMVTIAPDLRLEEIVVRQGSPLDGKTVGAASNDRGDVTILAVKKSGAALVPSPSSNLVLGSGDLVVALGPSKVLGELSRP
ncbi:MAG: potassium channel protein [Actinomycetota bacterium]